MLTNETKQRINTCRDILVGKLPDPKSQVIQITNALIYKFMDDQDRLAEKLDGKASFFIKELKPYAWHKLFDSKLTNQERADLYIEGVQTLSQAKHLPELFQEIFKEAYVPFRAAQTITLFITEINKFDYNHSEELGNAYEYLLSIMGSQGDAGQFRTPRHIIEFMVDVVDPQKSDTVYDPACGTAGFLISAYTHILEANNGKLSATERRKLGENIRGIDIDPEMAKMARVNLYLHGFSSPVINEGDTLSDEDLWGTKYDVILANPPFMSPKGGIIPHDKFGIKSSRAEVLFTDFISEHLKLKGKAAVVVPDGVLFNNDAPFKQIRKKLIESNVLFSVVNLPKGVFQPYSDIKTAVLIFDREKAKNTDEILFINIENDGYSLNKNRTEISGSQLPQAIEVLKDWSEFKKTKKFGISTYVKKSEILNSDGGAFLTKRYQLLETKNRSKYPLVALGDILDYEQPTNYIVNSTNYSDEYEVPVLTAGKTFILGYTNEKDGIYHNNLPVIIFDDFTTATKYVDFPFKVKSSAMKILKLKDNSNDIRFIYQTMQNIVFDSGEHKRYWISEYAKVMIPLPSPSEQKLIMLAVDKEEKEIALASEKMKMHKYNITRIFQDIWGE